MIRSITAYTREIDNVEAAVSEIMASLSTGDVLSRNSVGILSCYPEFIDSGVVGALAEHLPFQIVGTTTIASATDKAAGDTILSMLVLTSDDTEFSVGLSHPITSEDESHIIDAYKSASLGLQSRPELILSFAPLIHGIGIDYFPNALDSASGGIPVFGTLSCDDTDNQSSARVIHSNCVYSDRMTFILLSGDVHPHFYVGNASGHKVSHRAGIITESVGNKLISVNNMHTMDYLKSVGLSSDKAGYIPGIENFFFLLDRGDGSPVVCRDIIGVSPDGYPLCDAKIPVGSTLLLYLINPQELRAASLSILEEAFSKEDSNTLIIYSCINRYYAQGAEPMAGIESSAERFSRENTPYIFSYAGGELCPVLGAGDISHNCGLSTTIIICAL